MTRSPFRFQFNLLTLLIVVTLLGSAAAWVSYQLNWIRDRHAALVNSYRLGHESANVGIAICENGDAKAPWSLRWFGEKGYYRFFLRSPESSPETERIRRLFPEARISGQ